MAYEAKPRRRPRQAVRRAWLYSLLLSLPALIFLGIFFFQRQVELMPALLLAACLLLYLALCASALVDSFVRPLQTLSNVVSSLREGDYSFRARGASTGDALGELATEINALADLLQKQRVRSLEATALLARILEVMHAPLFAFDRENRLQLVNSAGLKLLGRPYARCLGHSATELQLDELISAPDESIRQFGGDSRSLAAAQGSFRQDGVPHTLLVLADVRVPLQEEEQAAWKRLIRVLGHELSNSLAPIKSIAGSLLARVDNLQATMPQQAISAVAWAWWRAEPMLCIDSFNPTDMLAQLPPPHLRPVAIAPLIERVALLEQRLPVQLEPGPAVVAQC